MEDRKRTGRGKGWTYRYPCPLVLGATTRWATALVEVPRCRGTLDAYSRGVWVVEKQDVDVLWTRGFYGKGNLSRSEPSWLDRRCRELGLGGKGKMSAEEMTMLRRTKRKAEKAIKASGGLGADVGQGVEAAPTLQGEADPLQWVLPSYIENLEHLHLTLEETFFLHFALGCLQVDQGGSLLTTLDLWKACLSLKAPEHPIRPDHPFILHYVLYHHYRSLGWCVRSGLKFCVDYILYKRGPVFHHADFALVLMPEYQDPKDEPPSFAQERHSWTWLSRINRISSQVKKQVILVYIIIPSSATLTAETIGQDPLQTIKSYQVREITVKRFAPARNRD